ncbi:MAG: type I-D CRISPR-associated protein Cas7/Csc2 [bacterium]
MSALEFNLTKKYGDKFASRIPILPQGKFISIILIRETMSHAIFTTEGDILDTEKVQAGLNDGDPIDRVVMFKRKQIAPERRTGKALLRQFGIVPVEDQTEGKGKSKKTVKACYLIEAMCGECPDCLIYGYAAVEGLGARKSRVITDSGFSVRPYQQIQKNIKFNVIDEQKLTSQTITEFDHVKPQVFIPTVETCLDLTAEEFIYVLGNILKTTRYGKESSREGYMRNHLVGLAFSDTELFSNLEFAQAFYDAFQSDGNVKLEDGYLSLSDFSVHLKDVLGTLLKRIYGSITVVPDDELESFKSELADFWSDEGKIKKFLSALNDSVKEFVSKAPKEELPES